MEKTSLTAKMLELFARGLVGSSELGALDLRWGNAQAAEDLIRMIATREGFGDLLAEGLKVSAEKIEDTAPEYTVEGDNIALPAHDPGLTPAWLLPTPHQTGSKPHDFFHAWFERASSFPEIGINEVLDRFDSKGKVKMVVKVQNVMRMWKNLALCKFAFLGGV